MMATLLEGLSSLLSDSFENSAVFADLLSFLPIFLSV